MSARLAAPAVEGAQRAAMIELRTTRYLNGSDDIGKSRLQTAAKSQRFIKPMSETRTLNQQKIPNRSPSRIFLASNPADGWLEIVRF